MIRARKAARVGVDTLKGAVKACGLPTLITKFTFFTYVGYMLLEQIVKITVGGRITIPKDTRKKLGWVQGTRLRVLLDGGQVILEPASGAKLAGKVEG